MLSSPLESRSTMESTLSGEFCAQIFITGRIHDNAGAMDTCQFSGGADASLACNPEVQAVKKSKEKQVIKNSRLKSTVYIQPEE